ncbi:MAG TPA: hypothetical protein PKA13_07205 [Geminicoccaceae bacterium]|nr:hypothetical protein [Geminicoccus sp.]HMU49546.1 hypothetical protein [Geminicoccaceae bacterium]
MADRPDGPGGRNEGGRSAALGIADGICLAATPTFALMALATAAGGPPDMLCMGMQDTSPLTGMVAMYLAMSVFHLPPWLRLLTGRRRTHFPSEREAVLRNRILDGSV